MEFLIICGVVIIILLLIWLVEYRYRRPNQIVLRERKGIVEEDKKRWYPRHTSLAFPGNVYGIQSQVDAEARGKLGVRIIMDIAVAPAREHLHGLVRAGGWTPDVVIHATRELERRIHALIREFTEQRDIDSLQTEILKKQLIKQVSETAMLLGLELDNLHIQSIEPLEKRITEAMQRREADHILEETEKASQQARVAAEKARIEADTEILAQEHLFQVKKLELLEKVQAKEATLAEARVREEQKRRLLQIQTERQELELLNNHPELILLSPQLAQLAESSQQLRNARTVVNLQGIDGEAVNVFQEVVREVLKRLQKNESKKS
ncbi:MAG: hypothetical protein PHE86_02405 [Candidatus Marinimicrobia bacterium]|nr:hypothetical protein [Candidatus Neomarinimicrobiota bacterium]MDD5583079.1 hypothetical protein [Candidatus Neomarinimicrobiota bacterium]